MFATLKIKKSAIVWLTVLAMLAGLSIAFVANGQVLSWVDQFGSTQGDTLSDVDVDSAGNIIVAGAIKDGGVLPGQTSAGQWDAYLRKYGSAGNVIWTKQFGTATFDESPFIDVDSANNIYALFVTDGSFGGPFQGGFSDLAVAKFDSNGTQLWAKQFGTIGDELIGGIAVSGSVVYVSGATTGTFLGQTSAGGQDTVLLKLDAATGNQLDLKQSGTGGLDHGNMIDVDAAGNIYLTGGIVGGTFSGFTNLGGAACGDLFIRKLDSSFNVLYTDQFGTAADDCPSNVVVDGAGNAYILAGTNGSLGGANAGGFDAVVRKYNAAGAPAWTIQYGTSVDDSNYDGDLEGTSLFVGGSTAGILGASSFGSDDAFFRAIDVDSGALGPVTQVGTSGSEPVGSLDAVSANVYLGGSTDGTFPGETSSGLDDGYLVKYALDSDNDSVTDEAESALTGSPTGLTVNSTGTVAGSLTGTKNPDGSTRFGGASTDFPGVTWVVTFPAGTTVPTGTLTINSLKVGNRHRVTVQGATLPAGTTKTIDLKKNGHVCIVDSPTGGAEVTQGNTCSTNENQYRAKITCNGSINNFNFPDGPRSFSCTPLNGTMRVTGLRYTSVFGFEDADDDSVADDFDLCPNTAAGATVDANGCATGQTQANVLSVGTVTAAPGDLNVSIPISLSNSVLVAGWQDDLTLPNVINFKQLNATTRANGTTIDTNVVSGVLKSAVLVPSNVAPGSGDVLNLLVDVPETALPGEYPLLLSGLLVGNDFAQALLSLSQNGLLIIEEPIGEPVGITVEDLQIIAAGGTIDENGIVNIAPSYFQVAGHAFYTGSNIDTVGASAEVVIKDSANNTVHQKDTTTDANGNFVTSVIPPLLPGTYTAEVTITDFTFTGEASIQFIVKVPEGIDLIGEFALFPGTTEINLVENTDHTVPIRIRNIGNLPAGPSIARVFFNGVLLKEEAVPALAAIGAFHQFNVLVPGQPTGTHTLLVVADVNNSVSEVNEINNQKVLTIKYHAPGPELAPDLLITDTLPSNITVGDVVSLRVKVDNNGEVASGATSLAVFLDGVPAGSAPVNPITPGLSEMVNVALPAAVYGTHVITYTVDPDNLIAEWDEVNNSGSLVKKWHDPLPDLVGEIAGVTTTEGVEQANIFIVIRNVEGGTAGSFEAKLFIDGALVDVRTINPSDLNLFRFGNSSVSYSVAMPVSFGSHTAKLVVDTTNAVSPERSETNNTHITTFQVVDITPSGPDVRVKSGDIVLLVGGAQTSTIFPGGAGVIEVTATNIGDVQADNMIVSLKINNQLIGNSSPLTLSAGASHTASFNWTAPLTTGTVIAKAQVSANVDVNANNNVATRAFLVGAPLDITPPITTKTLGDADGDGFVDVITLNAADSQSGVKEIHYSINGGAETIVAGASANVVLPQGIPQINISFFAVDNAGNQELPTTQSHDLDQCPAVAGTYQGCPVGDLNKVTLHTVKLGGGGSTKGPLAGVSVRVFDRNNTDFQAVAGGANPDGSLYGVIYEADAGRIGTCVTGSDGTCIAGESASGSYLVIIKWFDNETGKTVYTGKQKEPSDFVSGLATKEFQIMKTVKQSGLVEYRGGSKVVVTGSLLEMIVPESAVWEGTSSIYPFTFNSDSNWTVDVCVEVPTGYSIVGVYDENGNLISTTDCAQTIVANNIKIVAFQVNEVGSPEPSLTANLKTKNPSGKTTNHKHQVNDLRKQTFNAKVKEGKEKAQKLRTIKKPQSLAPDQSLWWLVANNLTQDSTPTDIEQGVRVVAQENDIAIPEWDIQGRVDAKRLPVGMLINLVPLQSLLIK